MHTKMCLTVEIRIKMLMNHQEDFIFIFLKHSDEEIWRDELKIGKK